MAREGLKLTLLDNGSSGGNNGAPTLTTPTLTPTTLRNIEQMFLDSGDIISCEAPEPHENAAGFVPPSVEMSQQSYEDVKPPITTSSSSTLDWVITSQQQHQQQDQENPPPQYGIASNPVPPVIASLIKDPSAAALPGPTNLLLPLLSSLTPVTSSNNSLPPSVTLPTVPCTLVNEDNQNNNNVVASKKRVGRKGDTSSHLSPEEQLKRDLRRERNKEAAARCRKRRLDQTLTLQDEVDELDSKKLSLQRELENLKEQKDELELLLKNHLAGGCARVKEEDDVTSNVDQ